MTADEPVRLEGTCSLSGLAGIAIRRAGDGLERETPAVFEGNVAAFARLVELGAGDPATLFDQADGLV